jgi:PST family polysaccharide transporter
VNLASTTVLNGVAVLAKIATTLALNKIFAVAIGPAGYAVIGQFQNLVAAVTALTSGAIATGTTNFIACGICAASLVAMREPLAAWALADPGLSDTLLWLAGSLFLSSINALLIAILNGLKLVRLYVMANIGGSLVMATVAAMLVHQAGLQGALIALTVSPAVAVLLTAALFFRHVGTSARSLVGLIDGPQARLLGAFALIGLAGSVLPPIAQSIARDGVARQLGLHDAGLWQALVRISDTHLMLLTTTLSVYLLPRLSEIREREELAREVTSAQRFVVPLVIGTSLALWLSRDWLVPALLSPAFLPLTGILGLQLLGDIVKISSWIFAYTLVSRAQTRSYITLEVAFTVVSPALTIAGAALGGLPGTAIGYGATYMLYWAATCVLYRRLLKRGFPTVAPAHPAPATA